MILFSEVEFFTSHPPGLAIFCSKKETHNFQVKKSDGERNLKNSHFPKTLNFTWMT